jgi:hypothetical protein
MQCFISVKFRVNPWQCLFLIPSLTHPALNAVFCFRVNLLLVLISVKFRVNPWQCLFLIPSLTHPALNAVFCFRVNLLLVLISVKFRVNPWQMLLRILPSVEELLRLKEKLKSLFQLRLIHYYHSGQTKYYLVRRTQMQP